VVDKVAFERVLPPMFGKGRIDTETEPALSKQGAGFFIALTY
jgi:hypothetical protein